MPELLSLLGMLAVMLLILGGAFVFTRWAGRGFGTAFSGGHLRVLDRAQIGRDQQVVVVQAGERFFLLGASPSQISLLAELEKEEGELWRRPIPDSSGQSDFRKLLRSVREKKEKR